MNVTWAMLSRLCMAQRRYESFTQDHSKGQFCKRIGSAPVDSYAFVQVAQKPGHKQQEKRDVL
jgi:hypothetical protein